MSLHFCTFHFEAVSLKRLNIYIYGFSRFVKKFFGSSLKFAHSAESVLRQQYPKGNTRLHRNPVRAQTPASGLRWNQNQTPWLNRLRWNPEPERPQAPWLPLLQYPAPGLPLPPSPNYISADPQRNRTYPFRHRQSVAYNSWFHALPSEE